MGFRSGSRSSNDGSRQFLVSTKVPGYSPLSRQPSDSGPIERGVVHQVVVAQPFEPAERSVGHLEFHGVVEPGPTTEELDLRVTEWVIGKAQTRRGLVQEAPLEDRSGKLRKIAEGGDLFVLEAKSEVQGERTVDGPGILEEKGMAVRNDVRHDAERRAQLVITARIVTDAVRTRAGAGPDVPVHGVVGAGVVVQDVVELVGVVDVVGEPIELPADAHLMLLACQGGQITPTQRYQPVAKVVTAFDRPCIPADCVATRSHTPGMLPHRALSGGRRNGLGARGTFTTD